VNDTRVILGVEKCIHPPTVASGGFSRVGGQLMARHLRTVNTIDDEIRAVWPHLGKHSAKLVRDTAAARIDRLLEERYALTNGAPADPSEPKDTRV
jgi:hypothetical protein